LLLPEPSETCSSTEFQRFSLLGTRYFEGVMEAGFGFGVIVWGLLQQD
jgi:hypothetical protein